MFIKFSVAVNHALDESLDLLKLEDTRIQKSSVLRIFVEMAGDGACRQLVLPLHGALMLVDPVLIVALLPLNPCVLREEVLV